MTTEFNSRNQIQPDQRDDVQHGRHGELPPVEGEDRRRGERDNEYAPATGDVASPDIQPAPQDIQQGPAGQGLGGQSLGTDQGLGGQSLDDGGHDAGTAQLRDHWRDVQIMFVDDPKDAVTRADALVAEALEQLTDRCSRRREELESRWSRGDAADTEEMRQALRGYRELFDQLLGTASGATNI
ncbi:hypothetical protein D7D52_24555 [Nocardia yunnanensis]|uniref:Uncharacterized protein n=1 Tax=Nocardia yunnanensis TaxID=2382165 RepID=A0A386ZG78_9NOCA|nr:hypothetical protein [Nocardia yunnanensis]AYF76467.1 hypothetical protein D7D52_24555 [Nocardia yunnanensis]